MKNFLKTINVYAVGYQYKHFFEYSQSQVVDFAKITGDDNPIHLSDEYASKSIFNRPIMHGFLSASVFSKVFGTLFPGEGTIYISQSLEFKKPMFVNQQYIAIFEIESINQEKGIAVVSTGIFDDQQNQTIIGKGVIKNKIFIR